jgi:hypothetical protein
MMLTGGCGVRVSDFLQMPVVREDGVLDTLWESISYRREYVRLR